MESYSWVFIQKCKMIRKTQRQIIERKENKNENEKKMIAEELDKEKVNDFTQVLDLSVKKIV